MAQIPVHPGLSDRISPGSIPIYPTVDGEPEFKSKLPLFCSRHRVARPYRKNEQSYIESFNRTVRKECLGWQNYRLKDLPECQKMVELFLERYHYHRPHMGLRMMTPLRKEEECRISTEN
jgi:transposase InsO family protein